MAVMSTFLSQIWSRVSKQSQQQAVLASTTMLSQNVLKAQDSQKEFPSVTTQVKLNQKTPPSGLKKALAVG